MRLPEPRGTASDAVRTALSAPVGARTLPVVTPDGPEDEQLALFLLQQISYRRIEGVDPAWEEEPAFLTLRHHLERRLEQRYRDRCPVPQVAPDEVPDALLALIEGAQGPSLSAWVAEHGTIDHLREFVVHRAAYQLQEADPHSFAIPRLGAGVAKTALLELQLDEYGGHEPTEAHASLFATTMGALGLDAEADLDRLPAATLETNTLLNLFGRSRRLMPACLGHLAVFELTSVEAMARYAAAVRRALPGPEGTRAARFYDVHVAADGFHGLLAHERLVGGFVALHPDEASELLFGAAAVMAVEGAFTQHLLDAWEHGRSSLRRALPGSALSEHAVELALVS